MKVWKDVDEVVKATIEIPRELWEAENTMKEKPKKWDKKKENLTKSRIIYLKAR